MTPARQIALIIGLSALVASPSIAARRHRPAVAAATMVTPTIKPAGPSVSIPDAKSAAGTGICSELQTAIEWSQKRLSSLSAEGIGDDSAPRETMRSNKTTALLQEINSNVAQLGANKCPVYPHVISTSAYMHNAMLCKLADMKAHTAALSGSADAHTTLSEMSAACNLWNWTRDQ